MLWLVTPNYLASHRGGNARDMTAGMKEEREESLPYIVRHLMSFHLYLMDPSNTLLRLTSYSNKVLNTHWADLLGNLFNTDDYQTNMSTIALPLLT